MELLDMQFSNLPSFHLFGPDILLSTLFSNTLSLCSSLNVRDQVSRPYRIRQNYSSVYYNFYVFRHQPRRLRFCIEW
jgi:hypothetical protein